MSQDQSRPEPKPVDKTPKPPAERRDRRAEVEAALVRCEPVGKIVATVTAKYGVSARVVFRDMKRVRSRWDLEDGKRGHHRRQRVVRRMEAAALKLYDGNDPAAASLVDFRLGRLCGMGGTNTRVKVQVEGDVNHQHTHVLPDPRAYMSEVAAAILELGGLDVLAGVPKAVEVEVVKPAPVLTNGKAKANGKTNGEAKT